MAVVVVIERERGSRPPFIFFFIPSKPSRELCDGGGCFGVETEAERERACVR